jgi:uncharacterized protein YggE
MNKPNFSSNFASALVLTLIFLSLIKFFNIAYPLSLTSTNRSSELAVVGEGKVEVIPDTAYIDLGIVVNKANSVEEAQKQIDSINNKIINAMQKLGIKKGNVKTSNYSIYPNYLYENGQNIIDGYNGNVTVTVKVTNPTLASKVVSEGTANGANQVQGTRFVVDEPNKYRAEAREKAIKNAKEQAAKIAQDLGIRLGKVVNLIETTPGTYDGQLEAKMLTSSGGVGAGGQYDTDFQQGSQTVTSVVTLFFEKR